MGKHSLPSHRPSLRQLIPLLVRCWRVTLLVLAQLWALVAPAKAFMRRKVQMWATAILARLVERAEAIRSQPVEPVDGVLDASGPGYEDSPLPRRSHEPSDATRRRSSSSSRPIQRQPGVFLPRWAILVALPILTALQIWWLRNPPAPSAAEVKDSRPAAPEAADRPSEPSAPSAPEGSAPAGEQAPVSSPAKTAPPATPAAPQASSVKVQVLNATGIAGMERKVAEKLRAEGYDVVGMGTVSRRYTATTLLCQPGVDPAVGKDLVRILGKAIGQRAPATQDPAVQVSVIVGTDYRG